MVVAHVSDIHFGRLSTEDIVSALIEDIEAHSPALVVVSGDLTQRARKSQFRAAAEMIARLSAPVMVVPGNHDIPAWYRPLSRIFNPVGRYSRYITAELEPTFENEELAVAGINTAHGLTIKGGRIRDEHASFLRGFFRQVKPGAFKILVLHHHLVKMERLGFHDVAKSAKGAIDVIGEEEVDLVLCGHLHISSIQSFPVHDGKHHMVVASAGTATSSRGRGQDRKENLYNIVRIGPEHFVVEERGMSWEGGKFEFVREHPFSRD